MASGLSKNKFQKKNLLHILVAISQAVQCNLPTTFYLHKLKIYLHITHDSNYNAYLETWQIGIIITFKEKKL